MTQDEKCNISRLRTQGIGYRRIASILGLSENTVKSYLKRNATLAPSEKAHGFCRLCGKAIEQKPHKRKREFCSDYCRSRWWRKNSDLSGRKKAVMQRCKCCNKEFYSYTSENRSFCSRSCYIKSTKRSIKAT